MTVSVLQSKAQIKLARAELVRRGLSALDSPARRVLSKLRVRTKPSVGDKLKSWDVLSTVNFVESHVSRQGAILDIGAFASEVLIALHRLGYANLTGVDLNPELRRSPHSDAIRYEICDFMHTPFPEASFDAITAISVIEHGFQGRDLLKEISRLLRPNGYFIASFDYWPQKIDTLGQKFFNLDWLIFSQQDVEAFVAEARGYGLQLTGPLRLDAAEKPIECAGRRYTFAWLVFMKSDVTDRGLTARG